MVEEETFYDSLDEDSIPEDSPRTNRELTNIKPNTNLKGDKKVSSEIKSKNNLQPTVNKNRSSSKIPRTIPLQNKNISKNKRKQLCSDISKIVPLYAGDAVKIGPNTNNNVEVSRPKKEIPKIEKPRIEKPKRNLQTEVFQHDFTKIVPLYSGEYPKNKIQINRKKVEKVQKPVVAELKPKKSYLSMYYERINKIKKPAKSDGSNTSRAVCDVLSPKKDLDVNMCISPSRSNDDSETDEFYNTFIACEIYKKKASSPYAVSYPSLLNDVPLSGKKQIAESQSTSRMKPVSKAMPIREKPNDKLELLKRRQNYGKKMSMLNRIRLREIKTLKKINDNSE